jgi:hypothetical protein
MNPETTIMPEPSSPCCLCWVPGRLRRVAGRALSSCAVRDSSFNVPNSSVIGLSTWELLRDGGSGAGAGDAVLTLRECAGCTPSTQCQLQGVAERNAS